MEAFFLMSALSPAAEALMKAVISASPTNLACTVRCEFNRSSAIHIQQAGCSFNATAPNTQPCVLLLVIVDFDDQ